MDDFNPIDDLNDMLQPVVDETNQMIASLNQDGQDIEQVSAEDFYLPLVEEFVKKTTTLSLSEYLPMANPELALELGLITKREAIRAGYIPLKKEHVLNGTIGIHELDRATITALNFTSQEYKGLNY